MKKINSWLAAAESLLGIGIQDAFLLQIMRHGVLSQKRGLQADLSPDPFTLAVRLIRRMIAPSAAAKLRAEIGALDLLEVTEFPPRLIADGAGNLNFELQDGHWISSTQRHEVVK